jgi:hypothetical protein
VGGEQRQHMADELKVVSRHMTRSLNGDRVMS